MDISELNTRITIKSYTVSQNDETGKLESSLSETNVRWAKVVQNSQNKTLESLSISFKQAYTITKRFESDKPTLNNQTIDYGNLVLTIGSVIKKDIGNAWYEIINAYTTV